MVIKFINRIDNVSQHAWNQLLPANNPFLRHEFLAALEGSGAVCETTGWQPYHMLLSDNKKLIAAMPLYLKSHSRGEYVFDFQWADSFHRSGMEYYPKWLNAIPFTPCPSARILTAPDYDQKTIINICLQHIKQLSEKNNISSFHCLFPSIEQSHHMSSQTIIRHSIQFQWFNRGYEHFNDYLQSFSSRHRKKVKKERQLIRDSGIFVQQVAGKNITESQWDEFYGFYEDTYFKKGQIPYLNAAFFKQLAQTMPEQLMMCIASKQGNAIAACLNFISHDTLYGRYWGCSEEINGLHFEVCYYQGIEYCLQHNLQRFDSGAQGEHKISRGFEPIETFSAHWVNNPHFADLIAQFIIREKQWIAEYKAQCQLQLPFKQPG